MYLPGWIRLARWRDWFQSKLPFITASALLLAAPYARPVTIVQMMVTVAFWAAFGYGVNDIADRRADGRAGKANRAAQVSTASRTLFVLFTAGVALVSCLFWADSASAPGFVVAGLVLAVAYSVRPIRLKERGGWGLAAAAVAQWALPVLAVAAAEPGGLLRPAAWLLSALGFAIGLRWMAVHQLQDATADRRAQVRTYASSGADVWPVIVAAFTLEIGLLAAMLFLAWPASQPAVIALACWGIWMALPRRPRGSFRTRLQGYEEAPLSEYYFLMLPVALALGHVSSSYGFLGVAALLLLLGAAHAWRMLRQWQTTASMR
jgi:4-hydroxybenzoate polyprenyltransferase